MSGCPGLHCDGCGKGKLSAGGVLLLVGGIIYLANRQKINHAADDIIHWLLITLVILIATAVTVAVTAAGIKIRAWHNRRALAAQPAMIILPPRDCPHDPGRQLACRCRDRTSRDRAR